MTALQVYYMAIRSDNVQDVTPVYFHPARVDPSHRYGLFDCSLGPGNNGFSFHNITPCDGSTGVCDPDPGGVSPLPPLVPKTSQPANGTMTDANITTTTITIYYPSPDGTWSTATFPKNPNGNTKERVIAVYSTNHNKERWVPFWVGCAEVLWGAGLHRRFPAPPTITRMAKTLPGRVVKLRPGPDVRGHWSDSSIHGFPMLYTRDGDAVVSKAMLDWYAHAESYGKRRRTSPVHAAAAPVADAPAATIAPATAAIAPAADAPAC